MVATDPDDQAMTELELPKAVKAREISGLTGQNNFLLFGSWGDFLTEPKWLHFLSPLACS
jgi:hypothetical protein